MTELWERFAYYGVRSLLVLYLIDTAGPGWTQGAASRLYGWFIGLAYLTPLAGGWLADRYLGTNRSLVVGGAALSLGYFTLALGDGPALYTGLALIVLGTGFFKPNVYTMVGQLYRAEDPRRDAGFTVFYLAINLGALLGPLACAWLAAHPRYGWPYGFGAAGAAMLAGLGFYLWARPGRLRGVGLPPGSDATALPKLADQPLTDEERNRIIALAITSVFVVFFWVAFEQAGSSLNVFAAQRTDRAIDGVLARVAPGREVPAAWFQALNPLFILLLAPLAAGMWGRLGSRAPSTPAKMALGLILLGLAYVVMVVGAAQSDAGLRVSPWFLVAFYFVYSCGEICFLPVGISFVSQAAPGRLAATLMGAWFTANFVASVMGGYLAGMVQRVERGELFRLLGGQADYFLIFVVSSLLAGGVLASLVPILRRLLGDQRLVRAWSANRPARPQG